MVLKLTNIWHFDPFNQFTAIMTTHVVIENVMYCAIMTTHVCHGLICPPALYVPEVLVRTKPARFLKT